MTPVATPGGLPPQTRRSVDRAIFTHAYAVIPREVMTDIVISRFPGWDKTRGWVLARPLTGFAETFSQILMEIGPDGGGCDRPETESDVGAVLFVTRGQLVLTLDGQEHVLEEGGYVYLSPGVDWALRNRSEDLATFQWIRKRYEPVAGLEPPKSFVTSFAEAPAETMPETDGAWVTYRFQDKLDLAHDFQVNIVEFKPGGTIPFAETHVMEHGLFVLEGRGIYHLNGDWVEVEEGDFLWLRAFCPQSCYAAGRRPFRYLLYKDMNRMPRMGPVIS